MERHITELTQSLEQERRFLLIEKVKYSERDKLYITFK